MGRAGMRWARPGSAGESQADGKDGLGGAGGGMRGVITDSASPGGLRLADDLPEPTPAPHELVLSVRAFSINAGEASLIEQRPDG